MFATDDPGVVFSGLIGAALPVGVDSLDGPGAVGRLAQALRDAGVNLDIQGPRGTVASLGAGVDSALGRVLTGSGAGWSLHDLRGNSDTTREDPRRS